MTVLCSICLCVSFAIAVLAIVNFIVSLHNKKGSIGKIRLSKLSVVSPFHLLVLGMFVAATVMYFPVYATVFRSDATWAIVVKTPLLSAQNALQLFTINAGMDNITDTINTANGLSQTLVDVYTVYASIYFVVAPMLTAAFILSFVKGLYENWRYFKKSKVDKIYVFSQLNENSLTLARDILTNYKHIDEDAQEDTATNKTRVKRVIVFANVTQNVQDEKADLVSAAKELGAICLQKDISDVYLKSPKKRIYRKLYLISQDENENTSKALPLIAHCKKHYNFDTTHIYVFANSDESGILIDSVMPKLSDEIKDPFNIKVRRVNEKRNLIWNTLRQSETDLQLTLPSKDVDNATHKQMPLIFSSAKAFGETKYIDVLIVGMGQYGTELLKTVCWYCQMPSYRLRVHVFDRQSNCEEKVRSIAPELVQFNKISEDMVKLGEAYYDINFCNHAIDVHEASFADKIAELPNVSLAFVTLGNDKTNIDTSIKLRRIFGKIYADKGYKVPPILTVVYDSEKTESLEYGKLLKNDAKDGDYNIRFIGDVKTSYSLRNVEQNELEYVGLACHMHWAEVCVSHDDETLNDFAKLKADWQERESQYNTYEYNRRSSMAQAMHLMARTLLCEACSMDELIVNEHNRWNAYMRSDGYTVSPKVNDERLPKDTVAKIHPCLVPFAKLKDSEREKDSARNYLELVEAYEQKSEFFALGGEKTEK